MRSWPTPDATSSSCTRCSVVDPQPKVRTDPQTVLTRNRGASLVAELYAASLSVDFIQTHDVAALRDALTVLAALDQHAGS
jgi:hypothetical protein